MHLPIPDFAALVDILENRGIAINVTGDRDLKLDAPAGAMTPEIAMQVRRHRDLLVWSAVGRRTGHRWCPCTTCGQVALLDPGPRKAGTWAWPECRMTPGCPGRHTHNGRTHS